VLSVLAMLAMLLSSTSTGAGPPHSVPSVEARPNIVVYLSDDQTWASMTAEVMPYLFSEPFGSWVRFDELVYSTPLCCPSRASMLTGAYSYKVGVPGDTMGNFRDGQTLPVWLQAAGYRTGLVGKYLNDPHHFLRWYRPPGWSDWHAVAGVTSDSSQTENDYYDYVLNENGTLVSFGDAPEDYQVDVLTGRAVEFIESTPVEEPFYLVVSPNNPHEPIEPAPRHADLAVPEVTLPPNFNEADVRDKPAWVRALRRVDEDRERTSYRNEMRAMRSVDESLRTIIETLAGRGQLDDTVIVFTTDNGYSRGSHRYDRKICPYEECVSGPLWIRYPGATSGTVDELVSNIDIAPTLGQLAGVEPGIAQDGISLVPLLDGTATDWRTDVLLTWRSGGTDIPRYWAVRTADSKYVEYETGERELYDLATDPYELVNVVRDPAYSQLRTDMRTRLARLRERADRGLPSWP
jgi:arylsulfatase A-like enzyme